MFSALETDLHRTSQVAAGLAHVPNQKGAGRGEQHLVRLSREVAGLLEAAKPADQKMTAFLREAAVTVALQRLDASQK